MLDTIDPQTISVIALAIALTALVLGPGLGVRLVTLLKNRSQQRRLRSRRVKAYLQAAYYFFDGLPAFIEATWNWGPSVPNYTAAGSFPDQGPPFQELGRVNDAIHRAFDFYDEHSRSGGFARPTREAATNAALEIRQQFFDAADDFLKKEHPWRWRPVSQAYRSLRIPESEVENIRAHARARDGRARPT